MTKRAKRLQRIRQNPYHVSFDDLRQVIEDYGFVLKRNRGTSHYTFRAKVGERTWVLTIPLKKPHVKVAYVKEALQAIDEIIAAIGSDESSDDE